MVASVLLMVWAFYVWTLAPTVYVGDSGELTAAACLLGIPHPPGYPWFVIWGHVGTLFPFGNLAFRVNVATAAAGLMVAAGTARFTQIHLGQRVGGWSRLVSPLAVVVMGCHPLLWSQSTAAEVYTVAGVAMALLTWGWFRFRTGWTLLAFGWGCAVAGHPVAALFLPWVVWGVWREGEGLRKRVPLALLLAGCGALVFLMLPLRALAFPALAWGETETLQGWLGHILRQQYGVSEVPRTWGRLAVQYGDVARVVGKYGWGMMGLGVIGWAAISPRLRHWWGGSLVVMLVVLPWMLNAQSDPLSLELVSMFLFPIMLPSVMAAMKGLERIWEGSRLAGVVAVLVVSGGTFVEARLFWMNSRADSRVAYGYGLDVLEQVGEGSVAFLEGDNVLFPIAYASLVEQWPSEGTLYDETGNVLPSPYGPGFMRLPGLEHDARLREIQRELMAGGSRVYFNVGTHLANQHEIPKGAAGLLLALGDDDPLSTWRRLRMPHVMGMPDQDYMSRDLAALSSYFLGEGWLTADDHRARAVHEQASRWGWDNETVHTNIGNAWLRHGRPDEAVWWYRRASAANSSNPANIYNVGYALAEAGKVEEAMQSYQAVITMDPAHVAAWMGMGMMQTRLGRSEDAVSAFRQAVALNPNQAQAYYNLGAALGNLGRYPEAEEAFIYAVRVDPHFEKAQRALRQLTRMREKSSEAGSQR